MATDNLMNKITLYYSQMTKAEKKVVKVMERAEKILCHSCFMPGDIL